MRKERRFPWNQDIDFWKGLSAYKISLSFLALPSKRFREINSEVVWRHENDKSVGGENVR